MFDENIAEIARLQAERDIAFKAWIAEPVTLKIPVADINRYALQFKNCDRLEKLVTPDEIIKSEKKLVQLVKE